MSLNYLTSTILSGSEGSLKCEANTGRFFARLRMTGNVILSGSEGSLKCEAITGRFFARLRMPGNIILTSTAQGNDGLSSE